MVASEVHIGIPPAGDAKRVGFDRLLAVPGPNSDRAQGARSYGCNHLAASDHAHRLERLGRGPTVRAAVDNGSHRNAGADEVGCAVPAVIVVGEERDLPTGRDCEAVHIGPHRRCQHDAGAIVAAEYDAAFACAGGKHRTLGDDAPQPLPRRVWRRLRQVIGDTLHSLVNTAVIDAEHSGAGHQPDVR